MAPLDWHFRKRIFSWKPLPNQLAAIDKITWVWTKNLQGNADSEYNSAKFIWIRRSYHIFIFIYHLKKKKKKCKFALYTIVGKNRNCHLQPQTKISRHPPKINIIFRIIVSSTLINENFLNKYKTSSIN